MGQAEREDGPAVGAAPGAVPAPGAADQDTPPGGFTPIPATEGATAAELAGERENAGSAGTVPSPVTQGPAVDSPAPETPAPAAESPAQARATAAQQGSRTPEEIERDIEQTREELGETVAALAEKTDVKARAQDKVEEVKQTVLGKKDELAAKATEKKDELAAKGQDGSPSSIDPAQVASTAKETFEKPPAMAGAAFAGGFLLGLMIGKRRGK